MRVCLSLKNRFRTMYEEKYTFEKVADLDKETMMSYLPIMATSDDWVMLITETDLYDYPAVFFKTDGTDVMTSTFPKVVTKTEPYNARRETITETADFIAETDAARTFPWRIINLVDNEADLLHSHLTGQMARGRDMEKDWSWVKPGKVSWDWWSRFNLTGVDFEFGINTATYKHYIDFASEFGIPYITLDEGWTKDSYTPFILRDGLDLHELIRYGKEKNVELILWVSWLAVDKNFDIIFETYREWGVAGMKIDFMDKGSWIKQHPIAVGTRTFQLALYLVLDTGTHMLADSPERYRKERECAEFIAQTPTLYDETKVLKAKLGEQLIIAKRSGNDWYIGAIAAKGSTESIKLDFLGDGEYNMTLIKDGINAHQIAVDYKIIKETVTKDSIIDVKMVDEGGFVCRLEPVSNKMP